MSGYAIYIKRDSYGRTKERVKKIVKFLFIYWSWVITFLIIGFCVKEPMPNLAEFMKNLVGIDTAVFEYGTGYICVGMAWYVSFYIIVMLMLPLLLVYTKKGFLIDTIGMIGVCIILSELFYRSPLLKGNVTGAVGVKFFAYIPVFLIGYYCSAYNVFDEFLGKWKEKGTKQLQILLAIIVIILVIWMRTKFPIYYRKLFLDVVYAPLFIFVLLLVGNQIGNTPFIGYLEKLLKTTGKISMHLWFAQGIFFTPLRKLQFIVYWPGKSYLIFIWTFGLLFVICYAVSKVTGKALDNISKLIR